MADATPDLWQLVFYGGAALLIFLLTLRGWHLGVVRQTVQVLALGVAYVAAWIGAPQLAPYLKPLELPNFILTGIAAGIIGLLVFGVVSIVSGVLFKKTGDQSVGVVRFGFGLTGAIAGMLFGFIVVFAATVGVRLLGSLAQAELDASKDRLASGHAVEQPGRGESSPWIRGIAGLKRSIEHGPAGSVIQQLDPVPGSIYSTLQKLGAMASSPQKLQRFLSYPGVQPLAEHPKIQALQNDPEIVRAISEQDFLLLLRNPRIVDAANDPEVASLMRKLEFEKALDYAVGKTEKPDSAPPAR